MRLLIGPDDFDLDRRPLILARLAKGVGADDDLLHAAKGLVGQGADLVEIALEDLSESVVPVLAAAGIPVVARLDDATTPTPPPGIHAVSIGGPSLDAASGRDPVPARPEAMRFTTCPQRARPGDGLVVAPGALDASSGVPEGVIGVVDLTAIVGRAEIAAAVTVALEAGARGFVTTVPSPVRRAAHVIRAVEHAR